MVCVGGALVLRSLARPCPCLLAAMLSSLQPDMGHRVVLAAPKTLPHVDSMRPGQVVVFAGGHSDAERVGREVAQGAGTWARWPCQDQIVVVVQLCRFRGLWWGPYPGTGGPQMAVSGVEIFECGSTPVPLEDRLCLWDVTLLQVLEGVPME